MKRIIRGIISIIGGGVGFGLTTGILSLLEDLKVNIAPLRAQTAVIITIYAVAVVFFALVFYVTEPAMVRRFRRFVAFVDSQIGRLDTKTIIFGVIGLTIGLVIALLLSTVISLIPIKWLSASLTVIAYLVCGYFGAEVFAKRRNDTDAQEIIEDIQSTLPRQAQPKPQAKNQLSRAERNIQPKILDTSVIIDGRIYDVMKTGIIEGRVLIPEFVLGELRHIADSADGMRRQKGRRGLDILARMQREFPNVSVTDKDYENMEVDEKLMRLAADMKGKVITNDLNLNKVATVKEVGVININQLATALKPPVMPGEMMKVRIADKGKELTQGLAYMDDGTMIVVDNAAGCIGQNISVSITSVLQTAAGRMVFARPA